MSNTVLRLEPGSAALSIRRRLETIQQCRKYVIETARRYDGLRAFEAELEKHGCREIVAKMLAAEPQPEAEGSD